jgi:hypothetical protein
MRLSLCDMTLERARLAFAKIEAFAPLNGMLDDGPPKPAAPEAAEAARLKDEARADLAEARKLIAACGYHRRDAELGELEAVFEGSRRFADLPPRCEGSKIQIQYEPCPPRGTPPVPAGPAGAPGAQP